MRRLVLVVCAAALLAGCGSPAVLAPAATSTSPIAAAAHPVAVSIPLIDAYSTLIPTGLLPDGTPEVPDVHTPMQASWFDQSPPPGQVGPAVLFGHVDGEVNGKAGQPGVFHRLRELAPGDHVTVELDRAATVTFTVDRVEVLAKAQFAPGSAAIRRVYGDTAMPELRLITCGGDFDRAARSYRDQVVVFAHKV